MQLGLEEVSWQAEIAPDFLWIAFALGRRTDWRSVNQPLDIVDRLMSGSDDVVDGRLSSFARVPADLRRPVREALKDAVPSAFPSNFGHVLGLFPDCPALWLYDDWLLRNTPDPEIGLPLLRGIVEDIQYRGSVWGTRARLAALVRLAINDKWKFAAGTSFETVPHYPHSLSSSEQKQLESAVRAAWLAMDKMQRVDDPDLGKWPQSFWSQCRRLAPCHVSKPESEEPLLVEDNAGSLDPEPLMRLPRMQAIIKALDGLGDALRTAQTESADEPDADPANGVVLGFASRLYRMLYAFLERPSIWVPDQALLYLRPIVDSRIVLAWLISRDEPDLFLAYQGHGRGRLKLLREHVKADFGDRPDGEAKEMIDRLDARVNLEREEMVQEVNVGSFTNVTPRTMAEQAGLKSEYDLLYAPMSSINHGEWPSLRDLDTAPCEEPLHMGHRLGAFRAPSRYVSVDAPLRGFELARDGIVEAFRFYGVEVGDAFKSLEEALGGALPEGDESDGGK
jgi:hypothetical protein